MQTTSRLYGTVGHEKECDMNTRNSLIFMAVAFVFFAVSVAAGSSDEEKAMEIGQTAAGKLAKRLQSELMAAMKKGGPSAAVDVCAEKAQLLTEQINRDFSTKGIIVKRTSLKLRNPLNAPDEFETSILKDFSEMKANNEEIRARVTAVDGTYRFVSPIYVRGLCTRCHGASDKLDPSVKAILAKRYPRDKAVDYTVGDLRGIFSVVIPKSALAGQEKTGD